MRRAVEQRVLGMDVQMRCCFHRSGHGIDTRSDIGVSKTCVS
jgi:hypothetical protein